MLISKDLDILNRNLFEGESLMFILCNPDKYANFKKLGYPTEIYLRES